MMGLVWGLDQLFSWLVTWAFGDASFGG